MKQQKDYDYIRSAKALLAAKFDNSNGQLSSQKSKKQLSNLKTPKSKLITEFYCSSAASSSAPTDPTNGTDTSMVNGIRQMPVHQTSTTSKDKSNSPQKQNNQLSAQGSSQKNTEDLIRQVDLQNQTESAYATNQINQKVNDDDQPEGSKIIGQNTNSIPSQKEQIKPVQSKQEDTKLNGEHKSTNDQQQNSQGSIISQKREDKASVKHLEKIKSDHIDDQATEKKLLAEIQAQLQKDEVDQELQSERKAVKESIQATLNMSKKNGKAEMGLNGTDPKQTKLKLDSKKSQRQKNESAMTEAEKEKLALSRLVKKQMQIFQMNYPELVEKNSIKYPIDDQLILKLPELHGGYQEKPQGKDILVSSDNFEQLLYIWEFLNNFSEYLETPNFRLEDLQAALNYSNKPEEVCLYDTMDPEELDWNEAQTEEKLRTNGFNLINQLHLGLIECFLSELFPDKTGKEQLKVAQGCEEYNDPMLAAMHKIIEEQEKLQVWPELIRLVVRPNSKFDFGNFDDELKSILSKMVGLKPNMYNCTLSYSEKCRLLISLIDGVHDTMEFRTFLNQRIEEKTVQYKQKMDIYAEIKELEKKQQEILKEHANSDFITNEDAINTELTALKLQLEQASRTEARKLQTRIHELSADKNKLLQQTAQIEDQIKKKHGKISKLNEVCFKVQIKTSMLGKDARKREYWVFKDDTTKVFIREPIQRMPTVYTDEDGTLVEEVMEPIFQWRYLDEDVDFEQLLERCNSKGVKERKLQENLKKVKDMMKLKRAKRTAPQLSVQLDETKQQEDQKSNHVDQENPKDEGGQAQDQATQSDKDFDNASQEDGNDVTPFKQQEERHHLLQNDNWYHALTQAIWCGKKIPQKKRGGYRSNQQQNRDTFEDVYSLANMKSKIAEIESLFTDSSITYEREWDEIAQRQAWKDSLAQANECLHIQKLLFQLDDGMSQPYALRLQGDKNAQPVEVLSDEENEEMQDTNKVSRMKLLKFKFWPSTELKDAWREYLMNECSAENLNALYVILQILDRTTQQFVVRQDEKMVKKLAKEQNSSNQLQQQQTTQGYLSNRQSNNIQNGNHRSQRQTATREFVKYFLSSDDESDQQQSEEDEEENDDEEQERSEDQDEYEQEQQPVAQKRKYNKKQVTPKQESAGEDDYDDEEVDESCDENNKRWSEYCFMCNDGGNVICCEGCDKVAHIKCLKMSKPPQGDWHCIDCQKKMSLQRMTRNRDQKPSTSFGKCNKSMMKEKTQTRINGSSSNGNTRNGGGSDGLRQTRLSSRNFARRY